MPKATPTMYQPTKCTHSIMNTLHIDSQTNSLTYNFPGISDSEASAFFESNASVHNYPIEVSDRLIERCATTLSTNELVVSRGAATGLDRNPMSMGTVRMLALDKSQFVFRVNIIDIGKHRE